ncbi:MAG: condensation domain-containing protein [Promethearchaeota archaeon]
MSNISTELKRKMIAREFSHFRVPNSNISLITRIKGKVTIDMLKGALEKAQKRHKLIRAHISYDESQNPLFVSNGIIDIPIKVINRGSDDQWVQEILKEHHIPFDFEKGPLIRFLLLQSTQVSDLIIFCQHIICDGMSLTYLARDIISYMGDPNKEVEILPDPPLPVGKNIPSTVKPSPLIKIFGKKIIKMWKKDEILFDAEDFKNLHQAYWDYYEYKVHLLSLTEKQTKGLVEQCRKEGVTVNTALITAFFLAQYEVYGEIRPYMKKIASAVNIRNRLLKPAGELLGFYASGLQLQAKYKKGRSFWEFAKIFHEQLKKQLDEKKDLSNVLNTEMLPPTMLQGQIFAAFSKLIKPGQSRYEKLSAFSKNEKNVLIKSIKKRLKKGIAMGQIMTNLGRIDFPLKYGRLELQEMILMPSCSPYTEIVLGVVTCNEKLNITINHMESTISTDTMKKITASVINQLYEIINL